ncbi:hypothetical protein [[Pseudomonas] boreopolis]|uniref:hypothetical protein n=1 Tax=Xanthomonas boreopolis TaxID=86183 RepID=UPI003D9FC61B
METDVDAQVGCGDGRRHAAAVVGQAKRMERPAEGAMPAMAHGAVAAMRGPAASGTPRRRHADASRHFRGQSGAPDPR